MSFPIMDEHYPEVIKPVATVTVDSEEYLQQAFGGGPRHRGPVIIYDVVPNGRLGSGFDPGTFNHPHHYQETDDGRWSHQQHPPQVSGLQPSHQSDHQQENEPHPPTDDSHWKRRRLDENDPVLLDYLKVG